MKKKRTIADKKTNRKTCEQNKNKGGQSDRLTDKKTERYYRDRQKED